MRGAAHIDWTRSGPDAEVDFYRRVLQTLQAAGVPVLVGGAYALSIYTGIERDTKDLDLFLRRGDFDRAVRTLAAAGYDTDLAFAHWLGKVHCGSSFVDLIFSSGNGVAVVDDRWFDHALDANVLGIATRVVPAEEMMWSKAFIMERERYDGADIAHLLRVRANTLDWARLLDRFGEHWRVLLAHVVLFGFVYPGERARVPASVTEQLLDRLRDETRTPAAAGALCRGTLLSREQYLHDVEQEGYTDARLRPIGTMSADEIAVWTEAIGEDAPPRDD